MADPSGATDGEVTPVMGPPPPPDEHEDGSEDADAPPAVSVADVLACSINNWYPVFRGNTVKTEIIHPLPKAFVDYLHSDGVMLPEHSAEGAGFDLSPADPRADAVRPDGVEADSDFDDSGSDGAGGGAGVRSAGSGGGADGAAAGAAAGAADEEREEVPAAPSFPEMDRLIQRAITRFGSVFPKLNWSCPQDATWMSGSMECSTPGHVYLLLKSSDLIGYDLDHAFDKCSDAATATPAETSFCLALRSWSTLVPAQEFRCFVRSGMFVAMCQRRCRQYFEFLKEQVDEMRESVAKFYDAVVKGRAGLDSFVFDVYIDRRGRVWLIDLNVYGGDTDPLLYTWADLAAIAAEAAPDAGSSVAGSAARTGDEPTDPAHVDCRVIESESGIVFSRHAHHALPEDVFDLASAGGIEAAVEQLRALGAADGSGASSEDEADT